MSTASVSRPRGFRLPASLRGWDGASRAVLLLVLAVVLVTFADYGVTWDEPRQNRYGELALGYYCSRGADHAVFSYFDLYLYGAAFDLLAALVNTVSPLGVYETRHLLNALVGIAGLAGTWRLARELAGPRVGFLAMTLLTATPDWYGHMYNNPKDIPFAAAMTWGTFVLLRLARQLPRPAPGAALGFGALTGLAVATRVVGGLLAVYAAVVLGAWAVGRVRAAGWGPALRQIGGAALPFVPAAMLAWGVVFVFWPWVQQAPIANPLLAVRTFSHFPHNTTFLYAGELVRSTDLPWHYLPGMLLVRMPLPVLVGLALAPLAAWLRWRDRDVPWAGWGLLTLAIVVPLALVIGTGTVLYDGLRHFLFLVPLIVVAAAASLDSLWQRVPWRRVRVGLTTLAVVWLALQVGDFVRVHPNQYILYNPMAGGISGAEGRFELDFWGSSLKETTERLVEEVVAARGEAVLDRPLTVVVCGPFDSVRPYVPETWEVLDARTARSGDLFVALSKVRCRLHGRGKILVRTEEDGAVLSIAGTLD